jgi:ribosomal protein L11 methylase PrmA
VASRVHPTAQNTRSGGPGRAALLVGLILPVFSLLAPCATGATTPSVLRRVYEMGSSYPALDVWYGPGPDIETLHDLLYAALDPFEPAAIHEHETGNAWRVFFRLPAQRDSARAALASEFGDRLIALSPADVDDEDWARRSQAALTAIRVGRIVVAPPWDVPERDSESGVRDSTDRNLPLASPESRLPTPDPASPESRLPNPDPTSPEPRVPNPDPASPEPRVPNPESITIVIEPSMGFGTGHHATTRLCLELLQSIELAGLRVIDVGTGSGVLALAAFTLGASHVTAMDNDPDALQNARENIARNGAPESITVIEADLSAGPTDRADVVVANLTGAVLQRYAAALRQMVQPGGAVIVSGFSPDEMDDVLGAFGMPAAVSRHEGEWAAAMLRMAE